MIKIFRVLHPRMRKIFYVEAPSALSICRLSRSIPATAISRVNSSSPRYNLLLRLNKVIQLSDFKKILDDYEINENAY